MINRHAGTIPTTKQIEDGFRIKKVDVSDKPIRFAWGLDIDGYFLQIYITDKGQEIFLEDGLIGTNKNYILDKLAKWGLVKYLKETQPDQFKNLILDLPL